MKRNSMSLLIVTTLLTGCAGDRTLDEYNRERMGEQLAQIRSVSGIYRGPLNLMIDSSNLGATELEISPDARIDTTKGAATQAQASLQGRIRIHPVAGQSGSVQLLSFEDGFYDPSNGDFKASVSLQQRNGQPISIKIAGTFANGTATGSIQAAGFSQNGAQFTLTRDLPLDEVKAKLQPTSDVAPTTRESILSEKYEGMAQWTIGAPSPLSMTLLLSHASTDQEFLDLFVPIKWVDLSLHLNDELVLFPNAQWNQETHHIQGETLSPSGSRLAISCQELTCKYYNHTGMLFQVQFTPKTEEGT